MYKNALVSVSDKTGLVEFLKPLVEKGGLRILSTGGTARHLKENGIPAIDVSEQTKFPEVMDGRVKTLHPHVHMALLARDNNSDDMNVLKGQGLEPFDLVIGNLYPFEKVLKQKNKKSIDQELVEKIDIGGPSFLRAAAKNFSRITVVCDPNDYQWILEKGELTLADRQLLGGKVFSHVAAYDSMIAKSFLNKEEVLFEAPNFSVGGRFVKKLRYGENPQQIASWYALSGETNGLDQAEVLQGKDLSYNNLLDLEAAISTLSEFQESIACVAVKHNNPCGVGLGGSVDEAVNRALEADPVSVFGGILAVSRPVDAKSAEAMVKLFLECVVAPDFSPEAMEILKAKKNLRVLKWPHLFSKDSFPEIKRISGGIVIQSKDKVSEGWNDEWQLIGEAPSAKIKEDIIFAWKVCAHLKSNAIAVCENGQTLGLGMGQVNRVDAVEQALERMKRFHNNVKTPVLASDAFFPFPDSIEKAAAAQIKWVVQPGGSVKDSEVIEKAQAVGVNLILTGRRHFLH